MKKSKYLRLFAIMASALMLIATLSGCQNGKKFDSPESMISEMTGTYSGSNGHSGERIVIDGNSIIRFNIDDIFPKITDDSFFWENFPRQNWEEFEIDALLSKCYIEITTEPISANIKKSTISDLWVNKDGVLFSQEGYPLNKTSSTAVYPTVEMQEKFEEYRKYLQEYEISSIIAEAEKYLSQKQDFLESALSSATASDSSAKKSTASAETIAKCAFDSLKDYFKYPRTATLEGFSKSPQYDSFGRVCTLITCTYQNGLGNYITEDVYVVLQSCSYSGSYTYTKGGAHYITNKDYFDFLLIVNDWNEDPCTDSTKEKPYNEAIQLIKHKEYSLATDKLDALGDYKSSVKLKEACVSFSFAERYKNAIDLFAEGKYTEVIEELSSLLKDYSSDYLKAERVIMLCNAAISNTSGNNGNASGDDNTSHDGNTSQKPSSCSHNYTKATCTAPQICTLCGQTSGSALGHIFSAATCTAPQTCTLCGEISGTALRHTYSAATCTTPQTCTLCGETSGTALGHIYSAATCTTPQICTLCGQTNGSALGHSYSAATCTTPQTCNSCGATTGSAAGHEWSNITQTVHHEEQGHYEDVQDAKKVQKYRCWLCSYAQPTYATKDAYYAHFDSAHKNETNSSFFRERYEMVEAWVYETVTVWVVDKEAYTETVVTGRECDICGKTE